MSEAEGIILEFLKAYPDTGFARKEIARKATHRSVYEENPHWVDAPLHGLLQKKLIALSDNGHYHLASPEDQEE